MYNGNKIDKKYILKLRKGGILGKVLYKDYCYMIKTNNLRKIKIFFPFSFNGILILEASNEQIIMKCGLEFYFYSKLNVNDNYVLVNILNYPEVTYLDEQIIINPYAQNMDMDYMNSELNGIYDDINEFIQNNLFITTNHNIYKYSLSDLNLVKIKKTSQGRSWVKHFKISENKLLYIEKDEYSKFINILELNSL